MTSDLRRAPATGHVVAALLFLVLGTAPTVGDIGGCRAPASELREAEFARARKELDCRRCNECGLRAARCGRACDRAAPPDVRFPVTCKPLVHDGDVCLRALDAASCDTFAAYVDDVAPEAPSECEFCRLVDDGGP